jgi:hypothetical protein
LSYFTAIRRRISFIECARLDETFFVIASPSEATAKQSNRAPILDCFVANAPRNDDVAV